MEGFDLRHGAHQAFFMGFDGDRSHAFAPQQLASFGGGTVASWYSTPMGTHMGTLVSHSVSPSQSYPESSCASTTEYVIGTVTETSRAGSAWANQTTSSDPAAWSGLDPVTSAWDDQPSATVSACGARKPVTNTNACGSPGASEATITPANEQSKLEEVAAEPLFNQAVEDPTETIWTNLKRQLGPVKRPNDTFALITLLKVLQVVTHLQNTYDSSELCRLLVDECLPNFVALLDHQSHDVQAKAYALLQRFSFKDDEVKNKIKAEGGIDIICKSLLSQDLLRLPLQLFTSAVGLLSNLCILTSHRLELHRNFSLPSLLSALEKAERDKPQFDAHLTPLLRLLALMVMQHKPNQTQVMKSGVPKIIASHMHNLLQSLVDGTLDQMQRPSEARLHDANLPQDNDELHFDEPIINPVTEKREFLMSCVGSMTWLCFDHKTNQRKFRQLRMLEAVKEILLHSKWSETSLSSPEFYAQLHGLSEMVRKKRAHPRRDNRKWKKLPKNLYKRHIHNAPWWNRYKLRPDKYVNSSHPSNFQREQREDIKKRLHAADEDRDCEAEVMTMTRGRGRGRGRGGNAGNMDMDGVSIRGRMRGGSRGRLIRGGSVRRGRGSGGMEG